MRFCNNCRMNCFPTRSEFNTKVFGIFAVIIFIIITVLTILLILSWFFNLMFFFYLFMILNPYLIYYGLIPKIYCPKCHSKCTEEPNKEYEPFGPKKGEGLPHLPYEKPTSHQSNIKTREGWFCPYCGASISRNWKHCKLCGKLLEINL